MPAMTQTCLYDYKKSVHKQSETYQNEHQSEREILEPVKLGADLATMHARESG